MKRRRNEEGQGWGRGWGGGGWRGGRTCLQSKVGAIPIGASAITTYVASTVKHHQHWIRTRTKMKRELLQEEETGGVCSLVRYGFAS